MTYNLSDAVVYGSEVCFDEKEQIKSFHNKFLTNKKHPVKMKWNCFIPAKVQTDVDIHRFLLHIFDLWFIFLFLCLVTGNISMQHDLFHFLYFKNIFLSLLTYLKTFNAGVFSHEDHCTFTSVKKIYQYIKRHNFTSTKLNSAFVRLTLNCGTTSSVIWQLWQETKDFYCICVFVCF